MLRVLLFLLLLFWGIILIPLFNPSYNSTPLIRSVAPKEVFHAAYKEMSTLQGHFRHPLFYGAHQIRSLFIYHILKIMYLIEWFKIIKTLFSLALSNARKIAPPSPKQNVHFSSALSRSYGSASKSSFILWLKIPWFKHRCVLSVILGKTRVNCNQHPFTNGVISNGLWDLASLGPFPVNSHFH